MSIVIALLTAAASVGNYIWWTQGEPIKPLNIALQAVLIIVCLAAMIMYRGKRLRKNYEIGKPRIFTFAFGVVVLSLLADIGVLIGLLMMNGSNTI